MTGHAHRVPEWQQAALGFTVPPARARLRLVDCLNSDGAGDQLAVVEVDTSDVVHATTRDDVFLRVGDENRKLNFRQRQELIYDKGQAAVEATPVPDAGLDELDTGWPASHAEALGHSDPPRLLVARGLATAKGELTVAGLLLFGRHPQSRYPEASVRVLCYRGTERGAGARQQLLHDVRCEGPIPQVLHQARDEVFAHVPTRQALGADGRFQPIGLIPEAAWLEGLVHAVVHLTRM